jgi:septal ring factor EnvC (AmiA/AmiB activator)
MLNRQVCRCLAAVLLFCCVSGGYASSGALDKINAKLLTLKNYLLHKQTKKNGLQTELSQIETQISQANLRVYHANKKISQQQKHLTPLQRKQAELQQQLIVQREALTEQLRAAYQMGQHTSLQLFLSQQSPSDVSRMASYYQALNQARTQRINAYLQSLQDIKTNQTNISGVLLKLQSLKAKRLQEQKVLQQKSRNRKVLLTKLTRQIKTSQQRIATLTANKKHLQHVVDNLAVSTPAPPSTGQDFASLKHRLRWPVKGKIIRKYGQIYDGRLHSNGVFFSAALNTPVQAVAGGEVIFANWLRGYGNMVIVSHRGGYMTLYGHNNSILVTVGQTVNAGDQIALAGNSGGLANSGMYFEVRYRSKTRNPALWCR